MKVQAIYNNGHPYLTMTPENELDDQLLHDCIDKSKYRLRLGGYGGDGAKPYRYFNIMATAPYKKPLLQRIKEVFVPEYL